MTFQSLSDYNTNPLFQSLIAVGIGGVNDSCTPETSPPSTSPRRYWQTTFHSISVNGQQVVDSTAAIIDTGTTHSSTAIAALYAQISAAQEDDSLGTCLYSIPCSFNTHEDLRDASACDAWRRARVRSGHGGYLRLETRADEFDLLIVKAPAPRPNLELILQPEIGTDPGGWFVHRAQYIPTHLTLSERKFLRLLDVALQVSEYPDKIDTIGLGLSKAKRVVYQIRELCAILSGLMLAADYKQGQELFAERDVHGNEEFYQRIFELGRRYKITNPDKMRITYGKLIYLLQDSQTPEVKDILGFPCVAPINTVYTLLYVHGALDMLHDSPLIIVATQELTSINRGQCEIQRDIKAKERAIETLSSCWVLVDLSKDTVQQALYMPHHSHALLFHPSLTPSRQRAPFRTRTHFHATSPPRSSSLPFRPSVFPAPTRRVTAPRLSFIHPRRSKTPASTLDAAGTLLFMSINTHLVNPAR
ncbi:hypothetical protein FA95DRAFT_1137059 [Auriscalpium vulgare]|uniref:Uncharacterized protein n=1 Tax=Auriscalpium vulgare TaxID=40419 RepID=A0ACB8R451_9AGAM|nr:hypothetical protein FA95DRAFT_1137059 [Auriscalpium vulgare]